MSSGGRLATRDTARVEVKRDMSFGLQVAGGTRSLAEGNEGRRPPARRLEVVTLRFSNHPRNGQKISRVENPSGQARRGQSPRLELEVESVSGLSMSKRRSASGQGQDPEHPCGPGTAVHVLSAGVSGTYLQVTTSPNPLRPPAPFINL